MRYVIISAFVLLFFGLTAVAEVPQCINYQGRLLETGTPANGTVSMNFIIWNHATSTDPSAKVWESNSQSVSVTDGLFSVQLGAPPMPALPHDVCLSDTTLYLGITVGSDAEIDPRTRLITGGFSYQSLRADTANAVIGEVKIGSNTFWANSTGIKIGDFSTGPLDWDLAEFGRAFNTSDYRDGIYMNLSNTGSGALAGELIEVGTAVDWSLEGHGARYGVLAQVMHNPLSTDYLYGVAGSAGHTDKIHGTSYGIFGYAAAGCGSSAIGVYGTAEQPSCGGAQANYAAVFDGTVDINGTLIKSGGSFKIDHPLDPENKYLQHSFVESPDMMNIYNGNVTTDASGYARVTLPDYFDALNGDFRYQLTVIGTFAQAIIEEEIVGNSFVIRTDEPNVKVSWQVTGVREDRWAEAHRIQVEVDKNANERGRYLHYKEYGVGIDRAVNQEQLEHALKIKQDQGRPVSESHR